MALKVDIEQAKKVKESSFEFEDKSHKTTITINKIANIHMTAKFKYLNSISIS